MPTRFKKTRKLRVDFEPMNPYERRIIHSSLQGNKYVETISKNGRVLVNVVVETEKVLRLQDGKSGRDHLHQVQRCAGEVHAIA